MIEFWSGNIPYFPYFPRNMPFPLFWVSVLLCEIRNTLCILFLYLPPWDQPPLLKGQKRRRSLPMSPTNKQRCLRQISKDVPTNSQKLSSILPTNRPTDNPLSFSIPSPISPFLISCHFLFWSILRIIKCRVSFRILPEQTNFSFPRAVLQLIISIPITEKYGNESLTSPSVSNSPLVVMTWCLMSPLANSQNSLLLTDFF